MRHTITLLACIVICATGCASTATNIVNLNSPKTNSKSTSAINTHASTTNTSAYVYTNSNLYTNSKTSVNTSTNTTAPRTVTNTSTASPKTNTNTKSNTNTTPSLGYTISSVAQHSTSSDCWMIINNNVYDVTNYLNRHPGGVGQMIPYCGQDATQAFATQGGQGAHSSRAYSQLASLYLGPLR